MARIRLLMPLGLLWVPLAAGAMSLDSARDIRTGLFRALASEYSRSDENAQPALEASVAYGGPDGVALARQVLLRDDQPEAIHLDLAVLYALDHQTDPALLPLLEEAMTRFAREDSRWRVAAGSWVAAFYRLHGDASFGLAADRARDENVPSDERALHLLVLGLAGAEEAADHRSLALHTYRPFLASDDPALQRAAVVTARLLWDFDAREDLEAAAFGQDPDARVKAYNLVRLLLAVGPELGPDGLSAQIVNEAQVEPYDEEAYRAWQERRTAWDSEQKALKEEAREAVAGDQPS